MATPGFSVGVWSAEEHERYLTAMADGESWSEVSRRVGTRSAAQCRSHHQKIMKKMAKARSGSGTPKIPRVEHRLPEGEADRNTAVKAIATTTEKQRVPPPLRQPFSPFGVDGWVAARRLEVDVSPSALDVGGGHLDTSTIDRLLDEVDQGDAELPSEDFLPIVDPLLEDDFL